MSGGSKPLDIVKTLAAPMYIPAKVGFDLATKGADPFKTTGKEVARAFNVVDKTAVQPVMKGFAEGAAEGMPAPEGIPTIASESPEEAADNEKKRRAKAARDTQVDILTNRPGRGGTILTDQYNYKV